MTKVKLSLQPSLEILSAFYLNGSFNSFEKSGKKAEEKNSLGTFSCPYQFHLWELIPLFLGPGEHNGPMIQCIYM